MNIDSLIKAKNQNPTEKVASQSESLDSILARAEQNIQQEKVAQQQNTQSEPITQLKTAALQLAHANQEEQERHARKLGFCISEGFIAGISSYEKAAEQLNQEKVASSNDLSEFEINLIREFRANPNNVVEKFAEIRDEASHDELIRGIHKSASQHYMIGYLAAGELINEQ